MNLTKSLIWVFASLMLAACGGSGGSGDGTAQAVIDDVVEEVVAEAPTPTDPLDIELFALIEAEGLTGDPSAGRELPSIDTPLAELGKALFFVKNLGGQQDAACVSCHHPSLGGADQLTLSVGVDAVNAADVISPDLLGVGRFHNSDFPIVPRNAPSVFNAGLWDSGLFWDSRVQSEDGLDAADGSKGAAAGIITPDSADASTADTNLPAGTSLSNAQARFPVTSDAEMRATFNLADDNQTLRAALAARFDGGALGWRAMFESAFGDDAINFNRIAEAIAAYEESMVFIDNPWKAYVEGDFTALTNQQKQGAILFFTSEDDDGGGCSSCHSGDFFTDEDHHVLGFPQVGPGKGDGATSNNDFGREQVTGELGDRFHFRTPTLLNVTVTAPYGHAGTYQTLDQVLQHYNNPRGEVEDFFGVNDLDDAFAGNGDYCDLPQVDDIITKTGQTCTQVFDTMNPNALDNSQAAVGFINNNNANSALPNINLNGNERDQIVAFLDALTDPCVENRTCLAPWILDVTDAASFPDSLPLIAVDENGVDL